MNPHVKTVQEIYQAFGQGDIPAILDKLAADVRWDPWHDNRAQRAGVPVMQMRNGPAEVKHFFEALGALQFHEFKVLEVLGGEHHVAAEVDVDLSVQATGRRFRSEEVHLWTFNADGKVQRFRHYLDTARFIWAFGLSDKA